MSDRRFLVVLVALLAAMLGLLLGAAALLELQDPVSPAGDGGEAVDLSEVLIGVVTLGLGTAVAGVAVATAIVRAQLRG